MDGPHLSALDLMLFHKLERDFFHRLVTELGQNQERMKWVMALWLWFESIGHHEFIRHVSAYQKTAILRFVAEAIACLDCLSGHLKAAVDPQVDERLPFTNSLIAEPMDLRFFDYHRSKAVVGISYFFDNVCRIIFNDVVEHGEGTSQMSAVATLPQRSGLNPMAVPWSPARNHSPEDHRSMFITFSRGYPISREDIMEYFTSRYGPCVDVVMIERAPPGQPPMYGRLVFKSASMIAAVLNGQRTAKFVIKGKHLWARVSGFPHCRFAGKSHF
ncbi:uncharacterized protein [Typha angustifolia]|uniref:uncharacterized protein n=1 Tax=Typha angustifolia TaxID=59011 RepID=UPI003C2DCA6D